MYSTLKNTMRFCCEFSDLPIPGGDVVLGCGLRGEGRIIHCQCKGEVQLSDAASKRRHRGPIALMCRFVVIVLCGEQRQIQLIQHSLEMIQRHFPAIALVADKLLQHGNRGDTAIVVEQFDRTQQAGALV